jgi:cytochrome c oxidase assembly protein subunit 15
MAALFMLQILGGGLNVTLKAPVWMQIVHLLMADAAWIGLVLLGAAALASQPAAAAQRLEGLRPILTVDDR